VVPVIRATLPSLQVQPSDGKPAEQSNVFGVCPGEVHSAADHPIQPHVSPMFGLSVSLQHSYVMTLGTVAPGELVNPVARAV